MVNSVQHLVERPLVLPLDDFGLKSLTFASVVSSSTLLWEASPPTRRRLTTVLLPMFENNTKVELTYSITRGGQVAPAGTPAADSNVVTGISTAKLRREQDNYFET